MDPVTAMALSVAGWLVRAMLNTIASNLFDAWAVRQGLGDDVRALRDELRHVQAVLCNADGRAAANSPFGDMLQDLSDAAHGADDLLDELDYFHLRDQVRGTQEAADAVQESIFRRALHATGDALRLTVSQFCCAGTAPACGHDEDHPDLPNTEPSTLQSLKFDRVEMGRRIRDAAEMLRRHCCSVHKVLLTLPPPKPMLATTASSRRIPTTPFQPPSEPVVVGRDELRDQVIGMLAGNERLSGGGPVLSVLPVVGQGGVGKTTFARYVYNDERLKKNGFQLKMWVCVSLGAFDIIRLTQKMLEHIPIAISEDGLNANSSDLTHLQSVMVKRLNGSLARFLLVLDDMWECTLDEWDSFIAPLNHSQSRGNVIIVTTRRPAIANMVRIGGFHPLELTGLQPVFLWRYFKFCIFKDDNCDFSDFKMREIAEKMVPKLRGSPLAAKTIGRLLGRYFDLHRWKEVLAKPTWKLGEEDISIMSVLKLSYEYLEFPVNRCFLYCGLFPDDYEFDTDELLRFWAGHGYIDPVGQANAIQGTGHEYLNTLVDHGFLEKRVNEGRITYHLHDFLHELARDLSSSECLVFTGFPTKVVPKTIRHVSILTKTMYQRGAYGLVERNELFEKELLELKRKLTIKKLNTVMLIGNCDFHLIDTFMNVFEEASSLRVLHISVGSIIGNSLSSLFSKLLHIRYVKLVSDDSCCKLPGSLSAYYHMKVFETNAKDASPINDISDLVNLCHFIAGKDLLLTVGNVGRLVHLQELKHFRVGLDDAYKLRQLGNMKELAGSLSISGLQNTLTIDEAREAKLEDKRIQKLSLSWDSETSCTEHVQNEVIHGLKPSRYLKELSINSYRGESIPKWLQERECYDCLESICFRNCMEWKDFLPFEMLYSLKRLEISGLKHVRKLEFGASDCDTILNVRPLEMLVVKDLQSLVKIEIKPLFPSLKEVSIIGCPKLLELDFPNSSVEDEKFQWFLQLKQIEIKDCPQLQRAVPPLPLTSKLHKWNIENVKSVPYFRSKYSVNSLVLVGSKDTKIIDSSIFQFQYLTELKVLQIHKCRNLEKWCGLVELHSLKALIFRNCWLNAVPKPQAWLLPPSVKSLLLKHCDITGQGLSLLLGQLPTLTDLRLVGCKHIYSIAIGCKAPFNAVDTHQIATSRNIPSEEESSSLTEKLVLQITGCVYIPPDLLKSLRRLQISFCPNVTMVGGTTTESIQVLAQLASLKDLTVNGCPKFFMECADMPVLPSKLESLKISHLPMLKRFESQLQMLGLFHCPCSTAGMEGLVPFFSHLETLKVISCEGFIASWRLTASPMQGLSMPLQDLTTDDAEVLTLPICSQLSLTLQSLCFADGHHIEMLSEEQEKALLLLSSLRKLSFIRCSLLSSLPQLLHCLPTLKYLKLSRCPKIQSLPPTGLPSTLLVLSVSNCSKNLGDECAKLKGIPKLLINENYEEGEEEI